MKVSRLISLLCLLSSVPGFSAQSPSVSALVDQYYNGLHSPQSGVTTGNCTPSPTECLHEACRLIGNLGCDDFDEIKQVQQMCRGNYSGDCLKVAASYLTSIQVDDRDEVAEVAMACRGNQDGSCIQFVCSKISHLRCDDRSEIAAIARHCAGGTP